MGNEKHGTAGKGSDAGGSTAEILPYITTPELSVAPLFVPENAARVRGLSKFGGTFGGLVRPQVRSSEACAEVQDRQRLPFIWPSAAPSSSFPTSPHPRAGLAKRVLRTYDLDGNPYKFPYPAEACATSASASHPLLNLQADPWESFGIVWSVSLRTHSGSYQWGECGQGKVGKQHGWGLWLGAAHSVAARARALAVADRALGFAFARLLSSSC